MDVDLNMVRGLLTLALLILFAWLFFWAYSKKRKQSFNEAANLPFADEDISNRSARQQQAHNSTGDFS